MLVALRVRWRGEQTRVVLPQWACAELAAGLAPSTDVEHEGAHHAPPIGEVNVQPGDDGPWAILRDGELAWRGADPAELQRRLVSEVHLSIAAHATSVVFIHAGVVAVPGGAVVVPGRSMSGKTTLVRELVARGAQYLSDEYAVITAEGMVVPYSKPLSIRTDHGVDRVPGSSVGAVAGGPVPVRAVVHTCFEPGAAWSPERGGGASVVMPLFDNAVAARVRPELVLDHTVAVARSGAVSYHGPRGEAAQTAELILDHLVLEPGACSRARARECAPGSELGACSRARERECAPGSELGGDGCGLLI